MATRRGESPRTAPTVDRIGSVRLERRVASGIAILVPAFGLIGAISLFSEQGPVGSISRAVSVLIALSTIPIGCWWWLRSARASHMPGWFVLYADVGVAAMLFTLSSRDLALYAAALFSVIGTYIAYFSRRRTLHTHSVFVNVVILILAVTMYSEGSHDLASTIIRTLVTLLVVNSVLAFRAVIKHQLELANTDSLTGLLNRRGLERRLDRLLETIGPTRSVVLLVVDLDQFKVVNDTYGHAIGDRVLESTARRLSDACGDRPCVARTGGEEFTIALALVGPDAAGPADEIRRAVHDPNDDVPVTVSVGAAVLSGHDWHEARSLRRAEALVHNVLLDADTAMYDAKRAGGNRATVYLG